MRPQPGRQAQAQVSFAWLEITGKCQLRCDHCYADSGPAGSHGDLTADDRGEAIDQLAELGARMVQFIGGEPTLHRALPDLVHRAHDRGLTVEVFTNLVHLAPPLWEVFSRTGNLDANVFTGLSKPRVLDVYEWEEGRRQRAEMMTLLQGSPCSNTDAPRRPIELPDTWWSELRQAVDTVAATPTNRVNADQELVSKRIRQRFESMSPVVTRWETVHGDLRWANLISPEFGLLDWELWGRGPAGTDAATLRCYSLLVPETAERVRAVSGDLLDTEAGRLAQLYVVSRLLHRVDKGDHPDLAAPLAAHAEKLI